MVRSLTNSLSKVRNLSLTPTFFYTYTLIVCSLFMDMGDLKFIIGG